MILCDVLIALNTQGYKIQLKIELIVRKFITQVIQNPKSLLKGCRIYFTNLEVRYHGRPRDTTMIVMWLMTERIKGFPLLLVEIIFIVFLMSTLEPNVTQCLATDDFIDYPDICVQNGSFYPYASQGNKLMGQIFHVHTLRLGWTFLKWLFYYFSSPKAFLYCLYPCINRTNEWVPEINHTIIAKDTVFVKRIRVYYQLGKIGWTFHWFGFNSHWLYRKFTEFVKIHLSLMNWLAFYFSLHAYLLRNGSYRCKINIGFQLFLKPLWWN